MYQPSEGGVHVACVGAPEELLPPGCRGQPLQQGGEVQLEGRPRPRQEQHQAHQLRLGVGALQEGSLFIGALGPRLGAERFVSNHLLMLGCSDTDFFNSRSETLISLEPAVCSL
jgi:hypothetical protein